MTPWKNHRMQFVALIKDFCVPCTALTTGHKKHGKEVKLRARDTKIEDSIFWATNKHFVSFFTSKGYSLTVFFKVLLCPKGAKGHNPVFVKNASLTVFFT